MSSTTSSSGGFLSSPRSQQRLMWISAAVLVLGVVAFLGVYFSRGTSQPQTIKFSTVATPPTDTGPKQPPTVAPAHDALSVARTFLLTAVLRKNLDSAYKLVGPQVKGGETLKQWRTGNIPVQFYPARNAKTVKFVITQSTKNHLMTQVGLAPAKGADKSVKPLTFWLGVDRIKGKWLVNYWAPDYNPLKSRANPSLGN